MTEVNAVRKKGFGGKASTIEDAENLTPRELFTWHTYVLIISIPAKYTYSKLEILEVQYISPAEIQYLLLMTGVEAQPDTKEEAYYRVVRENDQWRIDR